jgi:hypothetical protein
MWYPAEQGNFALHLVPPSLDTISLSVNRWVNLIPIFLLFVTKLRKVWGMSVHRFTIGFSALEIWR